MRHTKMAREPTERTMMDEKNSRRIFLAKSLQAGLVLPFLGTGLVACENTATKEEPTGVKSLNILILGGTSFLGPHQIAYALSRGHRISTFTRGKSKPTVHQDLFEQVEQLIGDREDDLTALENREWDAVIDNSGRKVEWTEKTAKLLKDKVDLYLYTSSTGVYYPYLGSDIKEDTSLVMSVPDELEDEETKLEYGYGVMKANSELAATDVFGKDRTIVVRPTYMVGPADKTNRFIHWPIRLSRGGETLVPGKTGDPVQYIDVRDVADWMIRLIEEKKAGIYNAVGPAQTQDMYTFVTEAQKAFEVESTLVQVDDYDFLKAQQVPYIIPWILPEGNNWGSARVSNAFAMNQGLTFRPLTTTLQDIHQWWNSDAITAEQRESVEQNPKSVLMREADILAAWKARKEG